MMKDGKCENHEEQLEEITKRRKNVPGLDDLRQARMDARSEEKYYDAMFARMLDAGERMNPSFFVRTQRDKFLELSKKYPRAAVYLRAKEYSNTFPYSKIRAGMGALQIIISGGSLRAAKKVLNSWPPEWEAE